jgi:hypothetical protein
MNTRILLAALAGGIAYFFIGWLVWGILLMDTIESLSNPVAGCAREMPIMWALAASNLIAGLLFAVIFDRWAGISTFKGGFMAGLLLGGLMAISWDLSMFAFQTSWTLPQVVIDIAANIIVGAIVGGIVGAVLGYKKV